MVGKGTISGYFKKSGPIHSLLKLIDSSGFVRRGLARHCESLGLVEFPRNQRNCASLSASSLKASNDARMLVRPYVRKRCHLGFFFPFSDGFRGLVPVRIVSI
jgi:hypothetical protein